jgi:hypothetical protein
MLNVHSILNSRSKSSTFQGRRSMLRTYKLAPRGPGHALLEVASTRREFAPGLLSIHETALSSDLGAALGLVKEAVSCYLSSDFDAAASVIALLTSWFSDRESAILALKISLSPLVSAYCDLEFDRLIWTAFASQVSAVAEPLIAHVQQLTVFADFAVLFSTHFFLGAILAYALDGYGGAHLVQYSLVVCFLLPPQSRFADSLRAVAAALPGLLTLLRVAGAERCALELLHAAVCAFPALADDPAAGRRPRAPRGRGQHRLYRVCIRVARPRRRSTARSATTCCSGRRTTRGSSCTTASSS